MASGHDDEPTSRAQLTTILDTIRARGGRSTPQRVAILQALLDGGHHATVETLMERVHEVAPDVHEATFYRTMATLEELGVVYHLHLDHGPSIWHLTIEAHEHLVCRGCGKVIEIDATEFDALRASVLARHDFHLDTHHFVSQGLCGPCAEHAADTGHDHGHAHHHPG
jgi:Fur family ferric uptake transcriptional regulator